MVPVSLASPHPLKGKSLSSPHLPQHFCGESDEKNMKIHKIVKSYKK
jgi:hypothetical protein